MKKILIAAAAVLPFAAACGTHSSAPDPVGHVGTRAHVIQEPYGFRNVSVSCDGVNGVYVTSRSIGSDLASGVAVVANDPNCK